MAHPGPAPNHHHILDTRPEYNDVDINAMIRDIITTLQQVSLDYPSPEKLRKRRRLPHKFNTKGWRRKLNERWKKKLKFIRSMLSYVRPRGSMSCDEHQDEMEASSQREYIEYGSYSSFIKEEPLEEEFFFLAPLRDEDDDLDETILYGTENHPHTLTMFKSTPGDTLIPHWNN